MKRISLSVKELAQALGISVDCVYRAYRRGEISATQFSRVIRFDLEKVRCAMERRAESMPYQRCTKRATGGDSRRRAPKVSPQSVKRGRNFQGARQRTRPS